MASKLGIEMKLFRQDGTNWVELTNVKDLSVDFSKGEADVTTRASGGWKAYRGTLKDFALEFQMVYDPADASFTAIEDAFMDNTALKVRIADGPVTGTGSSGTRYIETDVEVFGMKRSESNEEAVMFDVTMKRTHSTTPPVFGNVA